MMKQSNIPFSTLLGQLADPDSQIRLQAIKDILQRPAEREQAFTGFLTLLGDSNEQVLKAAIHALSVLHKQQAVPMLVRLVSKHPLARVRLRALRALVKIS